MSAGNFLRAAVLLTLLALLTSSTGCVRSKVLVTTDPPDASVTMNGVNLGKTPLEEPFTWYWYYDFIAEKEGYKQEGVRKRFHAPPWLWPGFDLLMEAMPFYVNDTKKVHIVLEPVDTKPAPVYVGTS